MLDAEKALALAILPGMTAAETSVFRFSSAPAEVATRPTRGAAVEAVANHGRWVVECPSGDGDAQFASRDDRRYMCTTCFNAANGGGWLRVTWPAETAEIEAILDARLADHNRNWIPSQTVADLKREDDERRNPPPPPAPEPAPEDPPPPAPVTPQKRAA